MPPCRCRDGLVHCRRKAAAPSIPSGAINGTVRPDYMHSLLRHLLHGAGTSDVPSGGAAAAVQTAAQLAGSEDGFLHEPNDDPHGKGRDGATAASMTAARAAGNMEEGQSLPGLGAVGCDRATAVTALLCDSEDEGTEGQEGLRQLPRRRTNAVISSSSEDEPPLGLHRQPRSTGEAAGVVHGPLQVHTPSFAVCSGMHGGGPVKPQVSDFVPMWSYGLMLRTAPRSKHCTPILLAEFGQPSMPQSAESTLHCTSHASVASPVQQCHRKRPAASCYWSTEAMPPLTTLNQFHVPRRERRAARAAKGCHH